MNIQKNNYVNFKGGLTAQMRQEIEHCDINKISKEFKRHNVKTNFKNNKVVAWCSLKCMQIIENFNKTYGLKLALPKGIFVEDFQKLNIKTDTYKTHGIHNIAPTKLFKNCNDIVSERVVFFNEHLNENYAKGNNFWDDIDNYSDYLYVFGLSPNNSFLSIFLHEFSHSIHANHLIEKYGGLKYLNYCIKNLSADASEKFYEKYCTVLPKNLGCYSLRNPFEAVACDLTDRFVKNTNGSTFIPIKNFWVQKPYKELSFIDRFTNIFGASKYDTVIKKCWDGKI